MHLRAESGEFMKWTNTLDPNNCAAKCVVNLSDALNSQSSLKTSGERK